MPRVQNWVSVCTWHLLPFESVSDFAPYQSPVTDVLECLSHCKAWLFRWGCCLANLMVCSRFWANFDSASGKEEWRSRRVNFWKLKPSFPCVWAICTLMKPFWNLICWCLSDPQNYSCANVDTQQRWNHWLRKTYAAYQKLQDSNNTLATPAFLFFFLFFL